MRRGVLYFLDRLSESSTWQGVGFAVSFFTARYHDIDWGQAAALGGLVSASIKAFLPDSFGAPK